jgi:HEAT repeat protein
MGWGDPILGNGPVEGVPDGEPTLVVQVVGWTGIACPTVQILIDNRPVGVLIDRRARSLPVEAGVHQMTAKVGFLRSRTLVLSLAPGDRITLACGFRRGLLALLSVAFIAVSGAGLLLVGRGLYGQAMAAQGLALGVMVADLLTTVALPGARLYLKRSGVPSDAGSLPERMDALSLAGRSKRERRGFRISLRGLLLLVACCAPLFWVARELWDRRPGNQPARAFRMLQSGSPGARLSGASDLRLLLILNSLTPKQVDAAISGLLVALRDQNSGVREAAAGSLHSIVFAANRRSAAVPRVQAVAAGLAEGLRDTEPDVRYHTGLALAHIYFDASVSGGPQPALPVDTERFVDLLGQAIEDPNPEVRSWALQVLGAIAPRLKRAAPTRLLAALNAPDAATRRQAIRTVVAFPPSLDSALPALLQVIERDPDPGVRWECSWALVGVRPSPTSIPLLMEALRSPERSVRFRAADLLSRIGPQASEAIPAVLPLLEETFEPVTSFDRQHPEWADPAVAATWALGAIAPGTGMADTARASLMEFQRRPGPAWRRRDAEWALGRLKPASTRKSGNVQVSAPSQ